MAAHPSTHSGRANLTGLKSPISLVIGSINVGTY
jgi:hypothetical protein